MNSILSFDNKLEIFKESTLDNSNTFSRLFLKGKFQEALAKNNNGRKYEYETLVEKIINSRCSLEQLKSNPLFGESIHPDDELTGEINPEKIIWRIEEAHMEGNVMMGTVEILPETPIGRTMYFLVEKYGANPGISSRGFGSMNGDMVDHDSYKFITFDGTFNPSTHGAFLRKISETSEMKEFIKSLDNKDVKVLSESSILTLDTGKSVITDIFEQSKHYNLNTNKMSDNLELLKESNKQIASLSSKLALSREEITEKTAEISELSSQLKEANNQKSLLESKVKENEEEKKESDEEKAKLEAKVAENEEEKKESDEEKEKLEENYNKAIAVIEGLREEYHKLNGFYNKSIQVLELVESNSTTNKVKELVESELGEFSKFETIFEGVSSLDKAKKIVESLKTVQSGSRPTQTTPLQERDKGTKSEESSSITLKTDIYDI